MTQLSKFVEPSVAVVLPFVGGILGSRVTNPAVNSDWYQELKKPWWRPPNWAFAPVWTTLYTGMGYASYLVWRDANEGDAKLPMALYGTQLALNWAWSPIFFGAKKLGWALADIVALWGAVAGCIYTFYPVNKTASYLMIPYLVWLTLAASINFYCWRNNPPAIKSE